ncbi:MAG TPA: 2-hydroxyacyl-CoA dehydratase family protein [Syntrophorhabdaceae bacterium]|nr:2-hydroxyacyl-CoA dehydratase family protein [Syntrophorhabdaceae bacterium]
MTGLQATFDLATADRYYREYGSRAKELKAAGNKIIGYLSALAPVEIMTAAKAVPVRLKGDVSQPITKADAYMETIVCPFVRNVFDSALKGNFNFLDGMVLPHQCDSIDRTSDVWNYSLKLPYWHFLNMPHVTDGPSVEFTKEILRIFIASLEKFLGTKITDQALAQAVKDHNENRRLMRGLYNLRRGDTPLITGVEMMKVLVACMSLPVTESSALIEGVTRQVKEREISPRGKVPRIMIVGDQLDDIAVIDTIEKAGAALVMDDISIGSKVYWPDVDDTADPVSGLAERYLKKLKIPTTFVSEGANYRENLEARFGHLKQYIDDFNINGVILFTYKYCDPYGFDIPAVKSFVESSGVPVLYLEDEYSTSTLPRIKTRIEAFMEMIV